MTLNKWGVNVISTFLNYNTEIDQINVFEQKDIKIIHTSWIPKCAFGRTWEKWPLFLEVYAFCRKKIFCNKDWALQKHEPTLIDSHQELLLLLNIVQTSQNELSTAQIKGTCYRPITQWNLSITIRMVTARHVMETRNLFQFSVWISAKTMCKNSSRSYFD